MVEISGTVADIIFFNEANNYTIFRLMSDDGDEMTITGSFAKPAPGEHMTIEGNYFTHPEYGQQLRAVSYTRQMPQGTEEIFEYLASGVIKGIRATVAERIVKAFGTDTFRVVEEEYKKLSNLKGISLKKALFIHEAYMLRKREHEVVVFLQEYGVRCEIALKLYRMLGDNVISVINDNPYIMCHPKVGMDFAAVDRIASLMGLSNTGILRIRAGIFECLRKAARAGSTYLKKDIMVDMAVKLLGVDRESICQTMVILQGEQEIYVRPEADAVYLPIYYNAEEHIAKKLVELKKTVILKHDLDIQKETSKKTLGIELSPEQREACELALSNGALIITGGPGTGKTTIIKSIIHLMKKLRLSVCLAAPTGRAAKRMSESCLIPAKTIHRLLEIGVEDDEGQYEYGSEIEDDVVIVDEMSMVDVLLMDALTRAIRPGTRLILVGDSDQLPSIGAGNVLCDLIKSKILPVVFLKEIYRQAAKSLIVVNAHKINNGLVPQVNSAEGDFFFISQEQPEEIVKTIVELVAQRLPSKYGFDPRNDVQVIAPTKNFGVSVGILNSKLQERLNPPTANKPSKEYGGQSFRKGDRVMQMRNDYEQLWQRGQKEGAGIYNGDLGVIKDISKKDECLIIELDDERIVKYPFGMMENLALAYAMTVHKSQGAEFPAVVMPMFSIPEVLATRNLLYTAITRARELVVLVGNPEQMFKMIQNNREKVRFTGLSEALELCIKY